MLAIFSGADVYSATIIVAGFMAGLGIGHLAGGQAADRVSHRASLALFCVAEMTIAVFAVFSASLHYGWLYRLLGDLQLAQEVMVISTPGELPCVWRTRAFAITTTGIDIATLMSSYVESKPGRIGPDFDRATLTDVNTDLFPKDEFDLTPP